VLWLRESEIDIGCIEITARAWGSSHALLAARQLLPLPETEDYFVRRRRREKDEEARRASTRGANSIQVLADVGVLMPGTPLVLGLETLTSRAREAVEPLVAETPAVAHAEWTGEAVGKSLRWEYDGKIYSATGLTREVLLLAGMTFGAIAGPDHWMLPDGRSMYRASLEIRAGNGAITD
jgi:hypothetical protein